jgi:hypothetical protein
MSGGAGLVTYFTTRRHEPSGYLQVVAGGISGERPFRATPGPATGLCDGDTIVKNWWAVVPSSSEQQIEPEQIRSAQEAVARGKATPSGVGAVGILILAVLAIVYTLYFGKEILLPIALALVLKLLLQPDALVTRAASAARSACGPPADYHSLRRDRGSRFHYLCPCIRLDSKGT